MFFAAFLLLSLAVALQARTPACRDDPYIKNPVTNASAAWPVTKYCGRASFFGGALALPEAAGDIVVLGFGLFSSLLTTLLVNLDKWYVGTAYTSEQFHTAGCSVGMGRTASVLVIQWTWAATLLHSSNVAHPYGQSGPYW